MSCNVCLIAKKSFSRFLVFSVQNSKNNDFDDNGAGSSSYKLETYNTKAYQNNDETELSEDWYSSDD